MLRDSTVVVVASCAPASNTASHDNHEKINSCVSLTFYGYGTPLGGLRPPELRLLYNTSTDVTTFLFVYILFFFRLPTYSYVTFLTLQYLHRSYTTTFIYKNYWFTPASLTLRYFFPSLNCICYIFGKINSFYSFSNNVFDF